MMNVIKQAIDSFYLYAALAPGLVNQTIRKTTFAIPAIYQGNGLQNLISTRMKKQPPLFITSILSRHPHTPRSAKNMTCFSVDHMNDFYQFW